MYLLLFALTFGILTGAYPQEFAGQVYQIAEDYSVDECVVAPECDCCTSDIIFLTERRFSMIARCIYSDAYYSGTYQVKDNRLTLAFKQIVVTEMVDEETKAIKNEPRDITIEPIIYDVSNCGHDRVWLKYAGKGAADLENGSRRTQSDEQSIIGKLYETEAWKLLLQ